MMKNKFRPKVIVMIDRAKLNAAQRIRFEFNLLQSRIAGYLSERERQLPISRKKVYFFLFTGICGSYFIWVTLSPLFSKSETSLNFGNIHAAKILEPVSEHRFSGPEIRLMNYIRFLDSLKRSKSGQLKYDSIARQHPGLMDTLAFIKSQTLPTTN